MEVLLRLRLEVCDVTSVGSVGKHGVWAQFVWVHLLLGKSKAKAVIRYAGSGTRSMYQESGTGIQISNVRNRTMILSRQTCFQTDHQTPPTPACTLRPLPSRIPFSPAQPSADKASCYPSIREHAIATQKILTYGLSRSPIRAHFQNIPMTPSLFRSMTLGNMECTYVDVQMMRRMTSRRDWKLKMAVMMRGNRKRRDVALCHSR